MMKLSGWGRHPVVESSVCPARDEKSVLSHLGALGPLICRGLGRSYGDSSLAGRVCLTTPMSAFLDFDEKTGVLACEAGVSLARIMEVFLPRGWFFPVTPGTKYITVGGAVASDVHGKNHHLNGSFTEYVQSFDLMLADGTVKSCSRTQNSELFRATAGGMGLTGVILRVWFRLLPVESAMIHQKVFKAVDLEQIFDFFEQHAHSPYSVAWIDCLSTGRRLGRSLLMTGRHARKGRLAFCRRKKRAVPFDFPSIALNPFSVKIFNELYYRQIGQKPHDSLVDPDAFFYPLDSVLNWNRIYGRTGFTQYQFVLPKSAGYSGMARVLKRIARAKTGSFLAVLKLLGPQNRNLLSFPMEGFTLALDMKIHPKLFALLNELDRIVLDHGGRLYLTKDVRMNREVFDRGYPKAEKFRRLRRGLGLDEKFSSLQSRRLEI